MPVTKMDHHNRQTAERIHRHPTSHNIQWHDVQSLLDFVGECRETSHGNVEVTCGEITGFVNGPIHRELSIDQVVQVRHFLRDIGITQDAIAKHAS
jgi:hypothetical protein